LKAFIAPLLILCAAALNAACVSEGGADLSTYSSIRAENSGALTPRFTTAAYFPTDQNTADIYLSDIPSSELAKSATDLTGMSGNIVHIHVFLIPSAGMTPIENTACNITVRHLILAGRVTVQTSDHDAQSTPAPPVPAIGLYGGGGFMVTSSDPGDDPFSGTIRDASVRLTRASPAFTDRLGPATTAGKFTAPLDAKLAWLMGARFEEISRNLGAR
jgi:hypothetical protein